MDYNEFIISYSMLEYFTISIFLFNILDWVLRKIKYKTFDNGNYHDRFKKYWFIILIVLYFIFISKIILCFFIPWYWIWDILIIIINEQIDF